MIKDPCLTLLPIAGEMLLTLPEPFVITRRPRFSKSRVALFLDLPNTFGTNTNSGPFETDSKILLPLATASELSGTCEIT